MLVRNSGKCDIEPTGANGDRVYGVLFSIVNSEAQALRDAEGPGYDEKTMNVGTAQGKETAIVYIANDIVSGLRPYDWYKAFVVAGAKEHGLPAEYVEWLKKFQSQPDTDEARRAREEAILGDE